MYKIPFTELCYSLAPTYISLKMKFGGHFVLLVIVNTASASVFIPKLQPKYDPSKDNHYEPAAIAYQQQPYPEFYPSYGSHGNIGYPYPRPGMFAQAIRKYPYPHPFEGQGYPNLPLYGPPEMMPNCQPIQCGGLCRAEYSTGCPTCVCDSACPLLFCLPQCRVNYMPIFVLCPYCVCDEPTEPPQIEIEKTQHNEETSTFVTTTKLVKQDSEKQFNVEEDDDIEKGTQESTETLDEDLKDDKEDRILFPKYRTSPFQRTPSETTVDVITTTIASSSVVSLGSSSETPATELSYTEEDDCDETTTVIPTETTTYDDCATTGTEENDIGQRSPSTTINADRMRDYGTFSETPMTSVVTMESGVTTTTEDVTLSEGVEENDCDDVTPLPTVSTTHPSITLFDFHTRSTPDDCATTLGPPLPTLEDDPFKKLMDIIKDFTYSHKLPTSKPKENLDYKKSTVIIKRKTGTHRSVFHFLRILPATRYLSTRKYVPTTTAAPTRKDDSLRKVIQFLRIVPATRFISTSKALVRRITTLPENFANHLLDLEQDAETSTDYDY